MILAAGLGSRLRPRTLATPKALLPVGGEPLLSILLGKMQASGFDRVVINVHHLAGQVERFLRASAFPEGWWVLSPEEVILGTGGGPKHAAPYLDGEHPVLLHNVDVLSDLPFGEIMEAHRRSDDLATLAVMDRPTQRPLAVDEENLLCGRWGGVPVRRPSGSLRPVAFNGMQVLRAGLPARLPGEGCFDLIESYLDLAGLGERIGLFSMDGWYWADVGIPERFRRVEEDLRRGKIRLDRLMA